MKLSFHQHIALFWMIGAPGVFAPVIENAKRPDAGAVMAWGVAIVAVMILFTPLLLRCPPFRRWYGRTDALSERQRQALAERGLRRYYQTAFDDGYVPRVMPYVCISTSTEFDNQLNLVKEHFESFDSSFARLWGDNETLSEQCLRQLGDYKTKNNSYVQRFF